MEEWSSYKALMQVRFLLGVLKGKKMSVYFGGRVWYSSRGKFRYSGSDRLVVDIDPGIASYYRSLIPKSMPVNGTRYAPHVTVVRPTKEVPTNITVWKKYEGETVEFCYSPLIHTDGVYFWLNVLCKRLEAVREELGLPILSRFTVPPEGFRKFFHATIANVKGI